MVAALAVATRAASRGVRNHARAIAADARSAEDAAGTVVGQKTAVDLSFTVTLETGFRHGPYLRLRSRGARLHWLNRATGHGRCLEHLVEMFCILPSSIRLLGLVSLLAACLGLNTASCLAQPIFCTVASTPYDRQMSPISPVLNSPAGHLARRTSLTTLNQWITSLRAIPYRYSYKWKTPAQVNADVAADCKGKAILLYAILRANGATHVRFVIGKHHVADLRTHAWLEWDTARGTYLLDPTLNSAVEQAKEHDPATYIPLYAYNGSRKYRAGYYRSSYATALAQN